MISCDVCSGILRKRTRFNKTETARVNSRMCLDFAMDKVHVKNNFLTDSIFISTGHH